jgi:hypothetical protein
MRFVWTVAGDDPDIGNCKAHGVDGYFAPLFDSLTTSAYLRMLRDQGGGAYGLYLGHNWFPGDSPEQLAQRVNSEYVALGVLGTRVMFNLEEHDSEKIARVLEEWRRLQPKVNTSWSPEGMQGGWMGPVVTAPTAGALLPPSYFVQRILACRVRVVPQAFVGNMARRESDVVLRDLTRRGFPESIVSIFYDAAQLGADWDGYAFTEGRLPRII